MSISKTISGCGCGCTGACSCGNQVVACKDESFKRPRFFAGQLLTEDDLQALTDYVVGKNRLRNRYLWGDGVVCGLSVTCHPCGGGDVIVAPGYALDCCGNDIVVPCPEELDIKALIRDLRQRQLAGYDCGDPCDVKDGGERTYGLYLNYTETLEDLVAPYTSTDPCGPQSCEASRVCEGYSFELRCDCMQEERTHVLNRIADCLGDLKSAGTALAKAQTAQAMATQVGSAVRMLRKDVDISFEAASVDAMRRAQAGLADLNALSMEEVDEDGNLKVLPTEKVLRLDIARYQILTGTLTRFRALSDADRETALQANPELEALVKSSATIIENTGPKITALSQRVISNAASRTEAEETVRLAQKYIVAEPAEGLYESVEAKFLALNTPASGRQISRLRMDAGLLKDWLLDRLQNASTLTRCDLYERARAVNLNAVPDEDPNGDLAEAGASSDAVDQLVSILLEYLVDCVCLALNPVCASCDDPAVLLACVTVKDCDVVGICNMSRRYVLSPAAMRYWLPPIAVIGDLFEWLCCELDVADLFDNDDQDPSPNQLTDNTAAIAPRNMAIARSYSPRLSATAVDENARMVLANYGLVPADVESLGQFSTNLAMLSARAADVDPKAIANRTSALTDVFTSRFTGRGDFSAADGPALRDRVVNMVNDEVSNARVALAQDLNRHLDSSVETRVSELSDDVAEEVVDKVTADISKKVNKDLSSALKKSLVADVRSNVKTAVARELTAAKMKRAIEGNAAVKTLKESNRQLTRDLQKVTREIAKLKTGGRS